MKEIPSVPEPGSKWKHFKGGLYTVSSLARDCEDSDKFFVVYRNEDGMVWIRELTNFLGIHENGQMRFIRL